MSRRSTIRSALLLLGALIAVALVVAARLPDSALAWEAPAVSDAAALGCSSTADYVGWNRWRSGVGLHHNLVVGFRVPIHDKNSHRFAVYFQGRPVDLPDGFGGGDQLLFHLRTRWLLRTGILDARQWQFRWDCVGTPRPAPAH